MYVNKKMKLNKFEQVEIPKNADFFARIGKRVTPESAYAGEEPAELYSQKIDSIAELDAFDRAMQAEEDRKKSSKKTENVE